MKRILFLGAAHFQIPPIRYARAAGYYVLTCDNRPESPGHLLAHEAHTVSTVDQKGVLELARSRHIDGIVSFGSDVSALTAAVVATALGLPGADVATVEILTRKSLFRQFLSSKGLQRQRYGAFRRDNIEAAAAFARDFGDSAVIKPVDSSGSKGVSLVHSAADIDGALAYAFSESRSDEVIIEEYIGRSGMQICGDGYMDRSKLAFIELGDGHFYDNDGLLAPFAETFPSTHSKAALDLLARKVETILAAAGYRKGPFNLDAIITRDGAPFIIEIGPRCGGNFIPTAIRCQTDVDLIAAVVEGCLDRAFVLDTEKVRSRRCFACYMLHSRSGGTFRGMHVDPSFCPHIVEENVYLPRGARVPPFRTASDVIGNLILAFASQTEMQDKIANFGAYCWPEVE
jgi:biotin carboxylase